MANIKVEFDGKVYTVDENALAPLASPLEQALIKQLAGTGAVIRLGGTNYNVDANKLASARNVLTDHLGNVAGTDSKVTVNSVEYGLSKTKLQGATDKMNGTLAGLINEGLEYELNEDGASYSVIGIGTCTDTDIVIPAIYKGLPVTELKSRIEWIEEKGDVFEGPVGTFQDCHNLVSITIPDSVTRIDVQAFKYCHSLTSVTIGNNVMSIGDEAFKHCSSLTSITIPDSVTSIGDRAFEFCDSLTSITMGNSVTSIGDEAFCCCSFTSITIPDSVTSIGYQVFFSCEKLTSVTIPDSVTSIGYGAFYSCTELYSVTIPDSVTSIGELAFYNCGLTSITIGSGVTSVDVRAFECCHNLTDIYIDQYEDESSLRPLEWTVVDFWIYDEEIGEEIRTTSYLHEQATFHWKERV